MGVYSYLSLMYKIYEVLQVFLQYFYPSEKMTAIFFLPPNLHCIKEFQLPVPTRWSIVMIF